jgi:hypothetical protein
MPPGLVLVFNDGMPSISSYLSTRKMELFGIAIEHDIDLSLMIKTNYRIFLIDD